MDTASGLGFRLARHLGTVSTSVIVGAILVLLAALVGVVLSVDLLLPGSEPIIVAPLRWHG